jgi:hypothetical protein
MGSLHSNQNKTVNQERSKNVSEQSQVSMYRLLNTEIIVYFIFQLENHSRSTCALEDLSILLGI